MGNNIVGLATEIVSSFVSHSSVPKSELPELIQTVHDTLRQVAKGPEAAPVEPKTPAVSIRRSITPNYLICLDDELRFRTLRRHLAGLGMTPQQYREKWNLPTNYPTVAANYAAQRSALAKKMGLGQKAGKARASGRK